MTTWCFWGWFQLKYQSWSIGYDPFLWWEVIYLDSYEVAWYVEGSCWPYNGAIVGVFHFWNPQLVACCIVEIQNWKSGNKIIVVGKHTFDRCVFRKKYVIEVYNFFTGPWYRSHVEKCYACTTLQFDNNWCFFKFCFWFFCNIITLWQITIFGCLWCLVGRLVPIKQLNDPGLLPHTVSTRIYIHPVSHLAGVYISGM